MELLVMIDACKRASARTVTAVLPYYGYARADRKVHVSVLRRSLQLTLRCWGSVKLLRLECKLSSLHCSLMHTQGRESIAAKLTANLMTEAGADRVLAMDLHSGQCVGQSPLCVCLCVCVCVCVCLQSPALDVVVSLSPSDPDFVLCAWLIPGYFDIPVDHVYGESVILDYLASKRISTGISLPQDTPPA